MAALPEIDVGPLLSDAPGAGAVVAAAIDTACREVGFFYVAGHGVDVELQRRLDSLARSFFALPESEKSEIAMALAGKAWRGWFPLGAELTSGVPDAKEGLYFGAELGSGHPRVREGVPLHGQNLFPSHPAELRTVVLDYMTAMTRLGQSVLSAMAIALGLGRSWFSENLTSDPLILFRIFRYPPLDDQVDNDSRVHNDDSVEGSKNDSQWSVGAHTDYGLLTLLAQDDLGGLQVETAQGWIDVPPRTGTFVCNLGDMLERLTGGAYRSTPHRVRNKGTGDRLSFPFFLDPSWDAQVDRLPFTERPDEETAARRWDHMSVHEHSGTYGEYILNKVGKVFPDLSDEVISPE